MQRIKNVKNRPLSNKREVGCVSLTKDYKPIKKSKVMNESNVGKVLLGFLGGAAVGAALGILFAPAKGTVTRRRISKTTRDFKNSVTEKLEDLVESAEDLIDEIKETASGTKEPEPQKK